MLDQIMLSPSEQNVLGRGGEHHLLPGTGSKSAILRDCGLRYIVNEEATQQCFELIRSDSGILDPANELLRLPAEYFWVEWLSENYAQSPDGHRLGALIEASPDGRSGMVTGFWQDYEGAPQVAMAVITFDLDYELFPPPGSRRILRLRHGVLPHLGPLFGHMLFHINPAWANYVRLEDPHGYDGRLRAQAEAGWFNVPFILVFAAMLNSEGILERRSADLVKLNSARVRRGRQPLLDHIEVSLSLGVGTRAGDDNLRVGGRIAPRLHHVRGHTVRRGSSIFWRSSHLRGNAERPILRKTVKVSAPPKTAGNGEHPTSTGPSFQYSPARL
ncbi:MAG: hypothetical protein H0W74_12605 [Sphingosinicella sp.]|nr:hypothetical protein [Sphingosinicella sp.]